MAIVDSVVVFVVSLLIGALGIYVGARAVVGSDDYSYATVTALIGAIVWVVVALACYMGFSAGASNAANAVAPLVGNGSLDPSPAILLAVGAISVGGFTIARRTLATVGNDITEMPILAALIVSTVGATLYRPLVARHPGQPGREYDQLHYRARVGPCEQSADARRNTHPVPCPRKRVKVYDRLTQT
jgi:hypothetical protein